MNRLRTRTIIVISRFFIEPVAKLLGSYQVPVPYPDLTATYPIIPDLPTSDLPDHDDMSIIISHI